MVSFRCRKLKSQGYTIGVNMEERNYKLKFKVDPKLYMDEGTFMPMYKAQIDLSILLDPQHDGHLWRQGDVDGEESALVDSILFKLRPQIADFVKQSKPFAIHGPI